MIYERLKSSTANFTKLLFKTVNTIHSSVCTEVKKFGTVKHFFVVVVYYFYFTFCFTKEHTIFVK